MTILFYFTVFLISAFLCWVAVLVFGSLNFKILPKKTQTTTVTKDALAVIKDFSEEICETKTPNSLPNLPYRELAEKIQDDVPKANNLKTYNGFCVSFIPPSGEFQIYGGTFSSKQFEAKEQRNRLEAAQLKDMKERQLYPTLSKDLPPIDGDYIVVPAKIIIDVNEIIETANGKHIKK